ncbi:MAG: NAD(P)-dependent oxidoreductase [Janthinobacterium lividum]
MSSTDRIAWIGTGKMGAEMVRRLAEAGHSVVVYDRVRQAAEALSGDRVAVAADAVNAVRDCSLVFSSLPDDPVLEEMVGSLASALQPDTVLVETSTVSPAASARVATLLAEAGVSYLRAPISGSTATARAGTLTVLASGPQAAMDRARPAMEAFASRFFHVGQAEEARTLKLTLNLLVGAMSALVAEALTFGGKGDLDMTQMLEVIGESVVGTKLVAYKRELLLGDTFEPAFTVRQMMKDFDLVLDTAKASGAPMFLTALVRQHYAAADSQGDGLKDFFVLLRQYRTLAGLQTGPDTQNLAAIATQ